MTSLLSLLLTSGLAFAQAPTDATKQPAANPKIPTLKLHVLVAPKSQEQERVENLARVQEAVNRYTSARMWLTEMTAKYRNDAGEDENHILGRHYADLFDEYQKFAIPMGDRLVEDFHDDASAQNTLALNTMIVDSQHLDLLLDGLQAQERKWQRNHAADRVEPGVVIVVK